MCNIEGKVSLNDTNIVFRQWFVCLFVYFETSVSVINHWDCNVVDNIRVNTKTHKKVTAQKMIDSSISKEKLQSEREEKRSCYKKQLGEISLRC